MALVAISGCAGIVGPAVGCLTGGPSLTGKVYKAQVPLGTKIVATPFTIVGGAVAGIPISLWNGFILDLMFIANDKSEKNEYLEKYVDPFGGFSAE